MRRWFIVSTAPVPIVDSKHCCNPLLHGVDVLQVNVGHPSEVDEIFDAISYSKGASVIRMLHNYIGDEVGN